MHANSEAIDQGVAARKTARPPPFELVAELTHRCPLGCPYCCNSLALEPRENELDAATWSRVFGEAAALGVAQVQLSGGEPGARRDLVDIVAHAREAGLRTILITSGVGISTRTMRDLWEAGLAQVQVSFQDADAVKADHIAGQRGAFQRKHALAAVAVRLGLPLTVNFVVHRANIGRIGAMVELALALGAERVELAPVRFHGWALKNRAALAPDADQIERAEVTIEGLRARHGGSIVIGAAPWREVVRVTDGAPRQIVVAPSGRVSLGRSAGALSPSELWNVRDHSLADICALSLAFTDLQAVEPQAPAEVAAGSCTDPYVYRTMSDH